MPYLYLLTLSNNENVAVLSGNNIKKKVIVGCSTQIFKKINQGTIAKVNTIEIYSNTYADIIKKVRKNSIIGVHCLKNECFLTVDNIVWWIGLVDIFQLVEYKLCFE